MALSLEGFRKKENGINALSKAMTISMGFSESTPSDDHVWKPVTDNAGNATALIRFLYNPEKEVFYETLRKHGFQGKGWYMENCPKTKDWNARCPACEHAEKMKDGRTWRDIPSDEQAQIRQFFSTVGYWTNIYVIKDKNNPENEGKVFKYCFGRKILAKIEEALKEDPITGEPGFSAFDPIHGADFRIVIKQVGGFNNYDDSRFSTPAPFLDGDEDRIVDILENKLYDLSYISADSNFKPYGELKKRFEMVMGLNKKDDDDEEEDEEIVEEKPKPKKTAKKEPVKKTVKKEPEKVETEEEDEEDSEIDDDYFQKLVDDL